MDAHKFEYSANKQLVNVSLSKPNGGGDSYQVLINNYYYGNLYFKDGVWKCTTDRLKESMLNVLGQLLTIVSIFDYANTKPTIYP